MSPRIQHILYMLLWTAETLSRPTFKNLDEGFESWSHRRGFWLQIAELERRNLLEGKSDGPADRIYRLTEIGRLRALGGRDPEAQWKRLWDGQWRMALFDIPQTKNSARMKLRRVLRAYGFGYLQNSVWITPDPLEKMFCEVSDYGSEVESFITFEGRPCSGEPATAIVAGAWDFEAINQRYARCLEILNGAPRAATAGIEEIQSWTRREHSAWLDAVTCDPLLPESLLPAQYLGRKIWRTRCAILPKLARRMI